MAPLADWWKGPCGFRRPCALPSLTDHGYSHVVLKGDGWGLKAPSRATEQHAWPATLQWYFAQKARHRFVLPLSATYNGRLIPSSYRPSFASVVQVAWQAYMSSVSYDKQHLAIRETHDGDTPVSVRGGAVEGQRVEGLHEPPSPGISEPPLPPNRPRLSLSGRRVTGRYAYRPREGNTTVSKGASSSVVLEGAGGVLNPSRHPKDREL